MMRYTRAFASVSLAAAGIAMAIPPALAHVEKDISPHRHYLKLDSGALVQVGPRLCDDPTLQNAFNEFHFHVHVPGADGLDHEHTPGIVTNGRNLSLSEACVDKSTTGK